MRSKCRTALLALLALLALGALATASASAAEKPEFETVVEKGAGYGAASSFHGEGGNQYVFGTSSFESKAATKTTLTGVTLKFKGGSKEEGCTNIESGTGLELSGLTATLGWINKAKNEVGVMFTGPKMLIGGCANWTHSGNGEKRYFMGDVIGEITPVGVKASVFTIKFTTKGETWEQLPQFFEKENEITAEKEGRESYPLHLAECSSKACGERTNWRTGIYGTIEVNFAKNTELVG